MTQQIINIGPINGKEGDSLPVGGNKINENFTELYNRANIDSRKLTICTEGDFPTQDATSISIEDGFLYDVVCPIITDKYFKMLGGEITGIVSTANFLTYTGTGDMFVATQNRMTVDNITVSAPNANIVNVVGDGTKVTTFRANVSNLIVNSCLSLAKASNGGILVLNTIGATGSFSGNAIELSGSGALLQNITNVALVGLTATGVALELGSTVSDEIEILNLLPVGNASAKLISGLANSGNISVGGTLSVEGCNAAGLTSPLSGIEENDIRSQFGDGNSSNLKVSQNAGDLFLDGASETITVLQNEWHEIGTPTGGGSWAGDISDRFAINSAGYIEYTGERTIDIRISGRATVEKVGGGADEIECRIAKNWTGATTDGGFAKSRASTQNSTPTSIPVGCLTTATQGDNFRIIFENKGSNANIVASVTSLEVRG